jgi:iron complex outermembrane receptor protein
LTPDFTVDGNFTWLHARYASYVGLDDSGFTNVFGPPFGVVDFSGHRLNNAPDYQAFVGASYKWQVPQGSLTLRGEVEYSSRFYFTPINISVMSQNAYTKGNVFLTYQGDRGWHARAFVRNVSDKRTVAAMHASGGPFLGSLINGGLAPPRMYGLELGYSF